MANKKRLIDADKVINAMQKCLDEEPDKKGSVAYFAFESIIELLKQEPTVDAVEVVRCKDCKYWGQDCNSYLGDDESFCTNPDGLDNYAHPDDFCSYGERRYNV